MRKFSAVLAGGPVLPVIVPVLSRARTLAPCPPREKCAGVRCAIFPSIPPFQNRPDLYRHSRTTQRRTVGPNPARI